MVEHLTDFWAKEFAREVREVPAHLSMMRLYSSDGTGVTCQHRQSAKIGAKTVHRRGTGVVRTLPTTRTKNHCFLKRAQA